MQEFLNRTNEFSYLTAALRKGGLYVLYGRRRVGKSRFLKEFSKKHATTKNRIIYYQTTQTTAARQSQDLWSSLNINNDLTVSDWKTFFALLTEAIKTKRKFSNQI